MKSSQLLSMALLGLATGLVACKDEGPGADKTQMLTSTTWKLTSATAFDITGPPDACSADDVYTFSTAGDYTRDEGATKCDASDDQTETGTWAFNSDQSVIEITEDGFVLEKQILLLTATTLKVKYTIPIFAIEVQETYGH